MTLDVLHDDPGRSLNSSLLKGLWKPSKLTAKVDLGYIGMWERCLGDYPYLGT